MNLSTLETLNLEEAKVQNLSSTDYTNPSPAFALSNSLKNIIFPIQDGMYLERINNNSKIETIIIPDYPTGSSYTMNRDVFSNNTNLKSVVLGVGTTTVPDGAFQYSYNLSTIIMNDNITKIGSSAFEDCTSLEYVLLPENLIEIGGSAFNYCINMHTITIPEHLTTFGNDVFAKMYSLTDVYVLGNDTKLAAGVFNVNQTTNFIFTGDAQNPKYSSEDYTSTVASETYSGRNPAYSGQKFSYSLAVLHYHAEATENYRIPSTVMNYKLVDPLTGTAWPDQKDITGGTRKAEDMYDTYNNVQYHLYATTEDQHSWLIQEDASQASGYVEQTGFWQIKETDAIKGDYEGWRYFLQGAQIEKEQDVWPEGRILDSRWYSVCYPFDLTLDQFVNAFGTEAALSKMETVVYDAEAKHLTLNFTEKVDKAGKDGSDVYMVAHTPYMIHPSRRREEAFSIFNLRQNDLLVKIKQTGETEEQYQARVAAVYAAAAEKLNEKKTVYSDCADGNVYTFIGNYDNSAYIPKGAYYLGFDPNNPTVWPLGYYRMDQANLAPWTPTCALVMPSSSSVGGNAKFLNVNFEDLSEQEPDNIANGINGPSIRLNVITTGDKVYNMNGQVVRDNANGLNTLPSGLYIINGRKVMIK